MSVPFLDLARLHRSIEDELSEAVRDVVDRSAFVGGSMVESFEQEFSDAHGTAAGAGCGSGTDALSLALRAVGVGPGDEVVVPSLTFVATAEAVVHVGATPVLADVDPTTLLLTPDNVDQVRTTATRAVVPVHLYGHVVPPAFLRSWRDDGLMVVEDAAQAHLATFDDESVGTVGHAACFSFYPGKNLGAWGDGGMVVSRDAEVVERVRKLRNHGREAKYTHDEIGWCSRLDGLQAAVLHVKLRHLPEWTSQRQAVADHYRSRLGEHLVPWDAGAVHHLLVARTDGPKDRDRVRAALADAGISTGVHYPLALSQQPSLSPFHRSTPVAERAADEVMSLPMDPLMPSTDIDQVCDALMDLFHTGSA